LPRLSRRYGSRPLSSPHRTRKPSVLRPAQSSVPCRRSRTRRRSRPTVLLRRIPRPPGPYAFFRHRAAPQPSARSHPSTAHPPPHRPQSRAFRGAFHRMTALRHMWLFFWRDLAIARTYRTVFIVEAVEALFGAATFYYIARFVDSPELRQALPQSGSYFAFS